jgi:hypothetical protein
MILLNVWHIVQEELEKAKGQEPSPKEITLQEEYARTLRLPKSSECHMCFMDWIVFLASRLITRRECSNMGCIMVQCAAITDA